MHVATINLESVGQVCSPPFVSDLPVKESLAENIWNTHQNVIDKSRKSTQWGKGVSTGIYNNFFFDNDKSNKK